MRPSDSRNLKELVGRTYEINETIWHDTTSPIREAFWENIRSAEHDIFTLKGKKRLIRYFLEHCKMKKRIKAIKKAHPSIKTFSVVFGHLHDAFQDYHVEDENKKRTTITVYYEPETLAKVHKYKS
ncbi:hypothetical protein ACFLU6_13385 [Acidobacteriota bacterium]